MEAASFELFRQQRCPYANSRNRVCTSKSGYWMFQVGFWETYRVVNLQRLCDAFETNAEGIERTNKGRPQPDALFRCVSQLVYGTSINSILPSFRRCSTFTLP